MNNNNKKIDVKLKEKLVFCYDIVVVFIDWLIFLIDLFVYFFIYIGI